MKKFILAGCIVVGSGSLLGSVAHAYDSSDPATLERLIYCKSFYDIGERPPSKDCKDFWWLYTKSFQPRR